MSTIGDRIRRARKARDNMSAKALALAVGYKGQSGISNIENRGQTVGGRKLNEIARVLRVPVAWLLDGPDNGDVPLAEPLTPFEPAAYTTQLRQGEEASYTLDASLTEAVALFKTLRTEQRLLAIKYMHDLASGAGNNPSQTAWESDSIPSAKAA